MKKKKFQKATANDIQTMIDEDNQFGIITYPKGYYHHYLRQSDLTNEEKKN